MPVPGAKKRQIDESPTIRSECLSVDRVKSARCANHSDDGACA